MINTVIEYKYTVDPLSLILALRDKYDDDVQVISVLHRIGEDGYIPNEDIKTVMKAACLPQYCDLSREIYDYYRFKFAQQKIMGKDLTPFRTKLVGLSERVIEPGIERKYLNSEMCLLYRLLDFYKEDVTVDELVKTYNSVQQIGNYPFKYDGEVVFVTAYDTLSKRNKAKNFIFKKPYTNELIHLRVDLKNNLIPLLNSLINSSTFKLKLSATVYREQLALCREFFVLSVANIVGVELINN